MPLKPVPGKLYAKFHNGVIICGPTTTGKTQLAEILARELGGALINTDWYYLYANQDYRLGLGLTNSEPFDVIPSYLFGGRPISHRRPSSEEFVAIAINAAREAVRRGLIPIFEGCSYSYNRGLIDARLTSNVFPITWSNLDDLEARIRARIDQLLEQGLLAEVRSLMDSGKASSWLVQKGVIYGGILEYLGGRFSSEHEMREIVTARIKAKALAQHNKYQALSGYKWLAVDSDVTNTAGKIIKQIRAA